MRKGRDPGPLRGALQSNGAEADLQLAAFGLADSNDEWLDRFRAAAAAEPLGQLGPYELLGEIGAGGQGVVYRARRAGAADELALKRLRFGALAGNDARRRLERELELAIRLDHPGIVRVDGLEWIDGQPLLVMEWINGRRLDDWMAEARAANPHTSNRRPHVARVFRLFVKICDALTHAHQRGVIHRDLKPSNILVDSAQEPHVLDFGLARLLGRDHRGGSHTAQFVGTPAYASPEQVAEHDAIDVRTDVYALGVMLYQALTGGLPHAADRPLVDLLRAIREDEPALPSSRSPGLPREVDAILLKALAKSPERRYSSVEMLRQDLSSYLEGGAVLAHPPSRLYRARKLVRRHRLAFSAAALVGALALGYAIHATWLAQRLAVERRSALASASSEAQARAVAERAVRFLQDMLAAARPAAGGADQTVLEWLAEASQRVDTELADQPDVAAEVHFAIGKTYRSLWMGKQAIPHLQTALAQRRRRFGNDSSQAADCLLALGGSLANQKNAAGVDMQREALRIRQALHGSEHVDVAESQAKLAYAIARTGGDFAEAEQLMDEALGKYRRLLGDTHRELGSCLHTYGYMLYRASRLIEAQPFYAEALRIFEAGPPDDPYYIELLHGYVGYLSFCGEDDQAAQLAERAIPLTRRVYGEAWTYSLLTSAAAAHAKVGRFDAARERLAEAIAFKFRELIREHVASAATLQTLGDWMRAAALRDPAPGTDGPPAAGIAEAADLPASDRHAVVHLLKLLARVRPAGPTQTVAEECIECINQLALEVSGAGRVAEKSP